MDATPSQSDLYRLLVARVRTAINESESLMLSDAWDVIPHERQRALAEVAQQLRKDLEPIKEALNPEPFSDED